MNKAAHYVSYKEGRKNANVVVDGRNLYTDGTCLSTHGSGELYIDFGDILSIHHITTYLKVPSGMAFFGIYIPIFFIIPHFCLVLFCMLERKLSALPNEKKNNFLKKTMKNPVSSNSHFNLFVAFT